jgi:hypothetical protein
MAIDRTRRAWILCVVFGAGVLYAAQAAVRRAREPRFSLP